MNNKNRFSPYLLETIIGIFLSIVLVNVNAVETPFKVVASDGVEDDQFGGSVSLSGNTALVGAENDDDNGSDSGSAYLFQRDGSGNWLQQAKLLPSDDGAAGDYFGVSVSLSGNAALVGAYGDKDVNGNSLGSAYIFQDDGSGNWTQQAKLLATDAGANDFFGATVSLSGNSALIGAYRDNGNAGSAYIFQRDGSGNWVQQAKLLPSDDGAAGDFFGTSVSLSGNIALVGAKGDDDNGSASGSAYLFQRDGSGNWVQQAKLLPSDDGAAGDFFGTSVSLSGNTALVGAKGDDDNGDASGSAYLFQRDGSGNWTQHAKIITDDGDVSDSFGRSVSLSGDFALIGSYLDDDNGNASGSAYFFNISVDTDADGIIDVGDNCPATSNVTQTDTDSDHEGDTCDTDDDNDGVLDVNDAFPLEPNEQTDTDGDGIGDNTDTALTVADGDVTFLITAINLANDETNNPGMDVIELAASGTYQLTAIDNADNGNTGLPTITSDILIKGNTATISGSSENNPCDGGANEFRIFLVTTTGKLTLNNTTVSGGCTFDSGGGGDAVSGGGIAVIGGTLNLNNSAILDTAGQPDGGLYNNGGSASVSR